MTFDEVKFHDITKRYVDCKYGLGMRDPKKDGFDCLNLIWDFYGALGVNLPKEWNGWTAENYAERWKNGEGREEFIEYLKTLGRKIDVNFMQRGDLIIFSGDLAGPAIYLGKGLALRIFFRGGMVHSIGNIKNHIDEVRKLI